MASQLAARLLIQTGRRLCTYRACTYYVRVVLYHLGVLAEAPSQLGAACQSWPSHYGGPRHIEPWLSAAADARHHRSGEPIAVAERKNRILAVRRMLEDLAEWGWADAPNRRLIFARDLPRASRPLPRYLPPDADRCLAEVLEAWPNRIVADALLLQRACGLRIGELLDLELDCVHEIPGRGAWLKVPLGKLSTARVVPLDDETLVIIDLIVVHRSPRRPLRHPRSFRLVEFLFTRRGGRISPQCLQKELAAAAIVAPGVAVCNEGGDLFAEGIGCCAVTARIGTGPGDQVPLPTHQRGWRDEEGQPALPDGEEQPGHGHAGLRGGAANAPALPAEQSGQSGQHGAVGRGVPWPRHLTS
ncbi:MAG: site-specific integrase [Acidimicrobiales bacterium]